MVVETGGNRGNGTSNSALQWAAELRRQGHEVRLVGIGSPDYPAKVNRIPLVSRISAKQQMQFAEPSATLFERAFDGADIVHIYMPFRFGRHALRAARSMGLPVTAGYHVQPENVTYSAGPLKRLGFVSPFIYWLFNRWLYSKVDAIHVPTRLGAQLLASHHYATPIHVISNGYESRFSARAPRTAANASPRPFHIVASGRLTNEKNHTMLIKAIARCAHAQDIRLTIAGTGPLKRRLERQAQRELANGAAIGFHPNADMPALLHSADLLVHPSIADLESVSVLEAMACGVVPVIADSPLSAAGHFALLGESLFDVDDVDQLAARIDWWIDRPEQLAQWGDRYARQARAHYAVEESVRRFVAMERDVIDGHPERGAYVPSEED